MRSARRAFTLVELMVVIAIIGLLASVLATSVVSKMKHASRELDKKVMQDLHSNLSMASQDDRVKRKLASEEVALKRGREFWEACFRHGILGEDMLPKMVSSSGNDFEAERRSLDNLEAFTLDPMNCSWAGPQGNELPNLITREGSARRIVICPNERNWFNHSGEVLTMWSDGQVAEYVTLEDLNDWGYGISEEQWQAPSTELFGSVKPFDGVFD